jgi:GntR family transcriptional repressor for pyruvate dehydrogenase complex
MSASELPQSAASPIDIVVDYLTTQIVDHSKPADLLPAEAEIAETLDVSRLTVREALKVLSGRGLVQLSRGRRAEVKPPSGDVLSDFFSIALRRDPHGYLELNEIRRSLEVLSAGLAAKNGSRPAIRAVENALERMTQCAAAGLEIPQNLEKYHEADVDFHECLAMASGNGMLTFLVESLSESLRQSFEQSARGHFLDGGTADEVVAAHRAVVEAVKSGDARGAERAMRSHLDAAERDLRRALRSDEESR